VVHNNDCGITNAVRFSLHTITAVIVLSLAVGCGGGGGASGTVRGILTDGFGAVITLQSASVTLDGTGEVAHPNSNGVFQITAAPGNYTLRGSFVSVDAGFRLEATQPVTLIDSQTLDVGNFAISYSLLDSGWDAYRMGQYQNAESRFSQYLTYVRSGQASLGSSSAFSALGWTRGRGLNKPIQASIDFNDAVAGWGNNLDAWVGLSGSELARMRSDGGYHFNEAVNAVTTAIDIPGDYTSTSTHDNITELDLESYRAFLNLLNGNSAGARTEALAIQDEVAVGGSVAASNAIEIVLAFTD